MRIAFIGQKGIPVSQGGIERHVEELSRQLVARGHRILVYNRQTYRTGDSVLPPEIKIVTLPSLPVKAWDSVIHTFLATVDVLFRKVDVVHYHHMGPVFFAFLVKLFKPSVKIVFTHHCDGTTLPYWGRLARWAMKAGEILGMSLADEVISLSTVMTQQLEARYGRLVHTIPNGVSSFVNDQADAVIDLPEKYILTTCRLIKAKGLDHLINAFGLISDDYPDYHLVIVGGPTKTDRDEPKRLLRMASYNRKVQFLGHQPSSVLGTIYKRASLFAQPSGVEGLPMVLLEAMAAGLPIVASDIPEHVVVMRSNGVKFRSRNPIDLAARLRQALQNLPRLREEARTTQQRVLTEFNWETLAERVEKVYGYALQTKVYTVSSEAGFWSRSIRKAANAASTIRSLF